MANYVPEGQDNSASKQTFGRRRPNYVPAEGEAPAARGAGADGQYEEAKRAADARHAKAKAELWEQATTTMLRFGNPGDAVGFLQQLPNAQRELHVLAEECTTNRRDVLSNFPAAGPTARETWRDFVTPAPKVSTRRKTA